jgi:class 3 adenylate cyclase
MPDADKRDADPASLTAADWLAMVRASEREGELFRAYDLARHGVERFPNDYGLKHRAVLCLASTGATRKATDELSRNGLDPCPPELSSGTRLGMDVATLKPRLLKDAALAISGGDRTAALAATARAYEEVYRAARAAENTEAYYPCINAATLSLLAGDDETSARLAREVLALLAQWPAERKSLYEVASELEAQLVLGDLISARKSAEAVRARVRDTAQSDYRGQATMLRQLRLIVEAKGLGSELLDLLAPPRVIHYLGHIISRPGEPGRFPAEQEPAVTKAIEEMLAAEDVGFGYGSLAAGADILFAEALLARGASLHIVLPFDCGEFVEVSVRQRAGDTWVDRFNACLKRATTVRYATEDRYLNDDHLFGYNSQLAMGLALLRAHHLSTAVEQIVVWDGNPPTGPAGTAADLVQWRRSGMPQKVIPVGNGFRPVEGTAPQKREIERRTRAMLFGDVHGFSKLTDEQLPRFIDVILGALARVIKLNRTNILLANTWGDGLFLVFDDAGRAANCALALQEALSEIDMKASGLPDDLGLRIGLHLGPAYTAQDPVLERENFFGAHVSRAARIEPVTPEGCVYVTETMAAVLALYNADAFSCEYVGMTDAAKKYGQMRMFLLNRVG